MCISKPKQMQTFLKRYISSLCFHNNLPIHKNNNSNITYEIYTLQHIAIFIYLFIYQICAYGFECLCSQIVASFVSIRIYFIYLTVIYHQRYTYFVGSFWCQNIRLYVDIFMCNININLTLKLNCSTRTIVYSAVCMYLLAITAQQLKRIFTGCQKVAWKQSERFLLSQKRERD